MEKFASVFKAANEDSWAFSEDAAYVLAFSIIMLNTDLHNASIADSKRMTLEARMQRTAGHALWYHAMLCAEIPNT